MRAADDLSDAWEAARAAWPGVELPLPVFDAHVRARQTDDATLQLADLYLAAAAVAGDTVALSTLDRVLLPRVDPHVRRIDASAPFVDEVRQLLRERVLVGRADGTVRLADYTGRGPLSGWLRAAAVRVALNLVATRRPDRNATLDEAIVSSPDADPELELLAARYGPIIRAAVRAALATLSPQDRNVLRFHLVAGVSTAKIAAMYHVNQSTVARWIQAARLRIREDTHAALERELGLPAEELRSLAGLLLSRLDVSLAGLL